LWKWIVASPACSVYLSVLRLLKQPLLKGLHVRYLLVSLLLLVTACASQGNQFDMDKARQLEPGVSTVEDAEHLIGKPISVTTNPNGHQVLIWMYAYGTGLGASGAKRLIISFDENGKMIRIAQETKI
jgi:outer membrane protein assembly factor BamE (lipoprotein component of BamABCDE complex)